MKEQILQDIPLEEREAKLKDSCDQVVERTSIRHFTDLEKGAKVLEVFKLLIERDELFKELTDIVNSYKARIEPLEAQADVLMLQVKQGGETQKAECYKFIDHQEGKVGYYAADGTLIEERKITPEDRQQTIFSALRENN